MKRFVPTVVTMVVGWITLLTYFLQGVIPGLPDWRNFLARLAIIVAAFVMILGFLNVFSVHATHVLRLRSGWFYSLVLLASIVIIVLVSIGDVTLAGGSDLARNGVSGNWMMIVYRYVLIPIQASLAALLPFLLAFAAYRTLRIRRTAGTALSAVVFLGTAILVLLGQAPLNILPGLDTALSGLREWIIRVPMTAGVRGILLGVALGVIATALRVLIGADRPTSD